MEQNNENILSEETIGFIKKCYIHLNQARQGVWAFADLGDMVWNPKLQKKNKELYFSIIHDAIAYEIIKYEEILEMSELKNDFLAFYSKFVSKINTSHEYTNFLEDRITTLENRFGLVWKEQEEQLLKIVSEDEIILGVGKFLINKEYEFDGESKDKKKKFIKNKENKQFTLTRKRGDSFLYFCKELNQLFLLYSVQSKINVYSFVENHYTKYYPILVKKGDKFGFGEVRDNLLIEGDNYFALQLLQFTHRGKIDVVYIDPPYNMGNGDFKYNDSFVSLEDGSRHSKWLSFIDKRLKLAKELLSDQGVIFISIDDIEYSRLNLICEEIFGEKNFINSLFVLDNLKGKSNDNLITSIGHKILVYAKDKNYLNKNLNFSKVENIFGESIKDKYKEHEDGIYNEIPFKKSGQDKERTARGTMYFPILIKNNEIFSIEVDEYIKIYNKLEKTFNDDFVLELKKKYENLGYQFILPVDDKNNLVRWTSGFYGFQNLLKEGNLFCKSKSIYEKKMPSPKEMLQYYADGVAKSLFYKSTYANGTQDLTKIVSTADFSYPKPVSLLIDLLKLIPKENITVLDFFAGSGTIGQAVISLNKQDNGKRNFILCTNNEEKICTDITYSRLERINNPKKFNLEIEQLEHGLEYLQIKHISDLDLESADDVGNFEYVKHINNVKFSATKIIQENEYFYITDTYSVFKKSNKNKQKEYCEFFDQSIKEHITNLVFVSSDRTEYDYFRKVISDYISTLKENPLFEKIKYYQMSKNYMDNMLSIINGEEEIDVEKYMVDEENQENGEQQ